MQTGVKKGRNIASGLGFIGDVLVDQHMFARGRFARRVCAMHAAGYTFGICKNEGFVLKGMARSRNLDHAACRLELGARASPLCAA